MIFNQITWLVLLVVGIVCCDITAAMKETPPLVPIFYVYSGVNDTMSFDRHGLMNFPKPNYGVDLQLYEKRFLSALNFNVEILNQRRYDANIIKCYISNLAAEIIRVKYDMQAQSGEFIMPSIYPVEKEDDLYQSHTPQENGFYSYPEPKNPFVSHQNYTKEMIRILGENITIAKQKGIDANSIHNYQRRIVCEITCMRYYLFIARYNQSPEYLFDTF